MTNDALGALTLAEEFRPQVAVIDIGLPDMDGYELIAAMQAKPGLEGCRFIAVTVYSSIGLEARSEHAGLELHLTKPLDLAAVLRAVAVRVER